MICTSADAVDRASIMRSDLTAQQAWVVDAMSCNNFGRIKGLLIRDGQPVIDPPPRVIQKIKLGGENGTRAERGLEDFPIKKNVLELFDHLSHVRTGVIHDLEFRHGLPFAVDIEIEEGTT